MSVFELPKMTGFNLLFADPWKIYFERGILLNVSKFVLECVFVTQMYFSKFEFLIKEK